MTNIPVGPVTVSRMLADPTLPVMHRLTHRGGEQLLRQVFLAESVREVERATPESLIVLSRAASSEAADYRLDMALRWASLRGSVAVAMFSCLGRQPSITALDLAERTQLTLISVPPETDLALLIGAVSRVIDGGAELALARAELSLQAIATAEAAGEEAQQMAAAASAALKVSIEEREPGSGDYGIPLSSNGAVAYACALPQNWAFATASRLIVHALAGAAARRGEQTRRDLESPSRSRSELLGELLFASDAHAAELIDWARQLQLPIDGWHVVVRIEIEHLAPGKGDELGRFELLAQAGQHALQTALRTGDGWYQARTIGAIVLVHMSRADPGPQAGMANAGVAGLALEGLVARFSHARFRAGVGAPHAGLPGLRASALESRAALLAMGHVPRGQPPVMAFDAVGIRRMLLEWYTSETAREAVRVQLAPLERLGTPKSDIAILTLQTYLDQQGSVVRTAQALHLHRNAVSYRLQRIFELLDVDASDPDQRLALQLACRARLMW